MTKIAFYLNCHLKEWKTTAHKISQIFADIPHQLFLSEYAGQLPSLVQQAVSEDFFIHVVAGGDGSINELINGLSSAEINNYEDFSVGIIPMGTGNDFCKTIQPSSTIQDLKSKILNNQKKKVDIGEAHFYDEKGNSIKRHYINITDVGMGGVVVENLSRSSSIFSKSIQYQIEILKTFFSYKKSSVLVQSKGQTLYEGKAMNVVVANGKYFGNGLGIAPEARIDDGQMEVIVLGDISTKDYLLHLQQVKNCQKVNHPQVFYFKSDEIDIKATDQKSLAIDMDGEFVGYAPLKIINISQRLYFYS